MNDKKRPFEGNNDVAASKKLKSDTTFRENSTTAASQSTDALIAQKRAEIAAKVASMRKTALGASSTAPPVKVTLPSSTVGNTRSPPPGASVTDDLSRRVLEAKRRVAEAQSKLAVKDNPYMSIPQSGKKNRAAEPAQQGAGLKMAAHPLLLDNTPAAPQSKKDRYKPMQPKFASIKANARNTPTPAPLPVPAPSIEIKANPYASTASVARETGFDGAPKERTGRNFRFNPKGKYVHLANQIRQDSLLEALKQRIAESAKKAGLDSEFETLEKNIRRPPPPAAEWWDIALLPNQSYKDLETGFSQLNIRTPNSPISIYIQHPIPIPAPGDKNKAVLKPLMLTKKEQKKMRKQRRQAELQDKRDRIRMGLIPPDPPKVRLANLMKVLTSDAIQDPTRVEARVRREVAMRKHAHEKMNAERKLTDGQRREKIETKKIEEEKKGIFGTVFKIMILSDPAHRFKVRKNAEQLNLSGVCVINPSFSMVYVEGAHKYIRNYKRLMLNRIAWTEAARPRGADDAEFEGDSQFGEEGAEENDKVASAEQPGISASSSSLEDNKCWLVWEGQLRDRAFNNFKVKTCPTDSAAKEALGQKLANYWDQTKNWKPEEESF